MSKKVRIKQILDDQPIQFHTKIGNTYLVKHLYPSGMIMTEDGTIFYEGEWEEVEWKSTEF